MIWEKRFTALILFTTCLLFFNWPLISITDEHTGFGTVVYIFFCWAVVIAGLRAYCCNEKNKQEKNEEGDENA